MFDWFFKAENRALLAWLGAGIVTVMSGAWAVVTYVWPHDEGGKSIVCAQRGSIAAGRDSSGNIVNYSGGSGPPTSAAPCVDTGKK